MCTCDEKVIETYSNSDGEKITKEEFDKAIENSYLGKIIVPDSNYTLEGELLKLETIKQRNLAEKKVIELEEKLKKTSEAFDYVLKLLIEVVESLKPKYDA